MIELLVGMIGSGKSQYSLKRSKEGAIICNDDSIVTALHGGDYLLYSDKIKPLYKDITNFIIEAAVKRNLDVVIDRTNLDIARRKRYIDLARMLNVSVICTCFDVEAPEEHARRRYWGESRGHSYLKWLEVAKFHLSEYTEPSKEEGFDHIRYVHFATGFMTMQEEMEARNT